MELLEAVPVFAGWYLRVFHSAPDAGFRCGGVLLRSRVSDDRLHHCAQADVRRSGIRLALPGVHHPNDQRGTVLLYGDSGAIPGKNLYGGEEAPHLPGPGKFLKINKKS